MARCEFASDHHDDYHEHMINESFLLEELKKISSAEKAKVSSWFFKTGIGQYGEGDQFIGVVMPDLRRLAKKYFQEVDLKLIVLLLENKIHEVRMLALLILTYKAEKANLDQLEELASFYLRHAKRINNWDLVDVSTPKVVGKYLLVRPEKRNILLKLVKSPNLWERRIAVLATFPLLKAKQFDELLMVSESLLKDRHDLIHKAVGWMLREMGKVDEKELKKFLDRHAVMMPRTMLRYAIEKFDVLTRNHYLGRK